MTDGVFDFVSKKRISDSKKSDKGAAKGKYTYGDYTFDYPLNKEYALFLMGKF